MIKKACKKAISLIKSVRLRSNSLLLKLWILLGNDGVRIGEQFTASGSLVVSCTDNGVILIGERCMFSDGCSLICRGGVIIIGNDVHFGKGVVLSCMREISIGSNALIAEYVVIRDQNHSVETRPIRAAGFDTCPVFIGDDVWLGAKASVIKGGAIGAGSVIGAHSLVRSNIPSNAIAVGVPAKVVKYLRG
jgi:acetyltransferase-like isoleucine patch superfamily enzyme